MVEPLRIHRNTHIFQLVEKENAPAEGAGRRGPLAPLVSVFWLYFYYAKVLPCYFPDKRESCVTPLGRSPPSAQSNNSTV